MIADVSVLMATDREVNARLINDGWSTNPSEGSKHSFASGVTLRSVAGGSKGVAQPSTGKRVGDQEVVLDDVGSYPIVGFTPAAGIERLGVKPAIVQVMQNEVEVRAEAGRKAIELLEQNGINGA